MSGSIQINSPWLAFVVVVLLAINLIPPLAEYLMLRWPVVGLGGAVFILLTQFRQSPEDSDRLSHWHWLLLAVYLVHQFEEHGVDLLGRVYYFHPYANEILAARGLELTEAAILRINTTMIWFGFLLAVWADRRWLWPGLFAGALMLTNGLFHIGLAAVLGEYNPGLLSSIVLFLPVAFFYFRFLSRQHAISSKAVGAAIAFGVVSHATLQPVIALDAPVGLLILVAIAPLMTNVIASRWQSSRANRENTSAT